jgi:hypothetical protein
MRLNIFSSGNFRTMLLSGFINKRLCRAVEHRGDVGMGLLSVIAFLFAFTPLAYAKGMSLKLVDRISLPGVTGRIDHMAVDRANNRLYIAALGNNSLEVVDLGTGKRVRRISRFWEPQGVVFMADSDRLVVTNGGDGACLVFNSNTFSLNTKVELHQDADNVRYDVATRKLFVAYGNGAIAIFDANFQRVGDILLPGHPESFALSRGEGRMFVNVPAIQAVVVVDLKKQQIVSTWKIRNARGNFPMALDEATNLLFVGTRYPSKLIGFDMQSGRMVFKVPLDGDPDDIFIDSQRRRIYVSCGEGYLDVVEWTNSGDYQSVERIPTAPGARTSLFVPEMRRLFLAVPQRGQHKAGIWIYEVQPEKPTNGHSPDAADAGKPHP